MRKGKPGTLFHFPLNITVGGLLLLAGVVIFIYFLYYPDYRSELKYLSALIGGLSVVYSAYYIAATLSVNVHRDKMARSFEFTKELNCIDMAKIRVFIERELDGRTIPPDEFYAKIMEQPELITAVKTLLGLFEDVSIAVQEGFVDELTLYKSLSFLVPWASSNFSPYILEERNRSSDERLYIELDRLANAWKERKSLLTHKEFPD